MHYKVLSLCFALHYIDLSSSYIWGANSACSGPQCTTGLDQDLPGNMTLVNPQANPAIDFSAYPAQNACKAIGGRLPSRYELSAIYAGRVTYGNNFIGGGPHWSATEGIDIGTSAAWYVSFFGGYTQSASKDFNAGYVRCIKGDFSPISPIPITAISLSGPLSEGDVITINSLSLTPSTATATYQWQKSNTVNGTYANIPGATTDTFTPYSADVGKFIKLVVTGNGYYTGTVTSEPLSVVEWGPKAGGASPCGALCVEVGVTYSVQVSDCSGSYAILSGGDGTHYPVTGSVADIRGNGYMSCKYTLNAPVTGTYKFQLSATTTADVLNSTKLFVDASTLPVPLP